MIKTCILLLLPLAAQSTVIEATTATNSFTIGDTVDLSVAVSNVSDLYAFQFDLDFPAGVLSLQSVTETGYFSANGVSFFPGNIDNTGGTVTDIADSLSGPGPGFSGSTLLTSASFKAISSGVATITPANIILLDSNLNEIDANIVSASIDVSVPGTSVPEPRSAKLLMSAVCFAIIAFAARFMKSKSLVKYAAR